MCDADTGEVVREGRAPHPDVTEIDARVWWQAWEQASEGILDDVSAVAVGGQQHGMVLVDDDGHPGPRRPAVERQPLRTPGHRPHRGARRAAGVGRPHRHRPGRQLHRHQAALGRRARARGRRARPGRAPPPRLDHPPAARRVRRAHHRPRRRVRHRLLVGGDRRVRPRPAAHGVRPRARRPPRRRRAGAGRRDARRHRARARHRRQHGCRARSRPPAGRRGGVAGHQRHRLRGLGPSRPPTPRASSPASPTRRVGSSPWCAPSTPPAWWAPR